MLVKRTITLKAKVTPEFQQEMIRDLQSTLQRLELELQQIEFQGKRLLLEAEKQGHQQVIAAKQQIEQKMAEVKQWEEGSEVVQGALEGWVDLKTGDSISRLLGAEILTENGKIIELRHE